MSISKNSELIGSSPHGFEAAAEGVVERAHRTLRGVTGFRVVDKRVLVTSEGIREYQVRLRLSFDVAPETVLHW